MCTRINKELTASMKNKLKPTGNIAWKIVEEKDGEYVAPLAHSRYRYNKNRKSVAAGVPSMFGTVSDGVFHLFSCRALPRKVMAIMRSINGYRYKKFKLVKVVYSKEDFYGAGENVNFAHQYDKLWGQHPNKAICVKGFEFVEDRFPDFP